MEWARRSGRIPDSWTRRDPRYPWVAWVLSRLLLWVVTRGAASRLSHGSPGSARPHVTADVPRSGNRGEVARATRRVRCCRQWEDPSRGPITPGDPDAGLAARFQHGGNTSYRHPTARVCHRSSPCFADTAAVNPKCGAIGHQALSGSRDTNRLLARSAARVPCRHGHRHTSRPASFHG
jgi:hypothetical protein